MNLQSQENLAQKKLTIDKCPDEIGGFTVYEVAIEQGIVSNTLIPNMEVSYQWNDNVI